MSGIGPDIAEVLDELGTLVTILRSPSNVTERITYDVNGQASNPFMREHSLAFSANYETVIQSGDLLQFEDLTYLVCNKTPDMFENDIVEYAGVMLKCNVGPFSIVYLTTTPNSDTFVLTSTWTVRKASCYGLIYRSSRSAVLNDEATLGKDTTFLLECFVPASYGAQKQDRVYISSTEYYRIQDIEKYAYPGIHILQLVEDDRVAYTP